MPATSRYQERPVRLAALAPWVSCVWVRQAPPIPTAPTLITPDGCVDLVWLDGALQLVGPDTGPREARVSPGAVITGIRTRPGAAGLLTGNVPAAAVADTQVELTELWGDGVTSLAQRVAAAPPWRAAELLAEAVAERLPRHPPDPLVTAAAAALDRIRPPSIAGLAAELGVSARQLRRRTVAAVGYGPQQLAQILRFGRLRAAAATGHDWARLAAETGYADQAHLTRQVRRWSGRTPTALRADR